MDIFILIVANIVTLYFLFRALTANSSLEASLDKKERILNEYKAVCTAYETSFMKNIESLRESK